MFILHDQLVD